MKFVVFSLLLRILTCKFLQMTKNNTIEKKVRSEKKLKLDFHKYKSRKKKKLIPKKNLHLLHVQNYEVEQNYVPIHDKSS